MAQQDNDVGTADAVQRQQTERPRKSTGEIAGLYPASAGSSPAEGSLIREGIALLDRVEQGDLKARLRVVQILREYHSLVTRPAALSHETDGGPTPTTEDGQ